MASQFEVEYTLTNDELVARYNMALLAILKMSEVNEIKEVAKEALDLKVTLREMPEPGGIVKY